MHIGTLINSFREKIEYAFAYQLGILSHQYSIHIPSQMHPRSVNPTSCGSLTVTAPGGPGLLSGSSAI